MVPTEQEMNNSNSKIKWEVNQSDMKKLKKNEERLIQMQRSTNHRQCVRDLNTSVMAETNRPYLIT